MEVGKVCKGTSIVLFIFDFIGSVILGNKFAVREYYSRSFNWTVFFYGVIIGFIFCLLIYALGEIIDQLEYSNSNTYELCQLLRKTVPKEENKNETKKSYFIPPAPTVQKTANGRWVCKECNTDNDSSALFCKNCGEYR